jgi:hypothetical protein
VIRPRRTTERRTAGPGVADVDVIMTFLKPAEMSNGLSFAEKYRPVVCSTRCCAPRGRSASGCAITAIAGRGRGSYAEDSCSCPFNRAPGTAMLYAAPRADKRRIAMALVAAGAKDRERTSRSPSGVRRKPCSEAVHKRMRRIRRVALSAASRDAGLRTTRNKRAADGRLFKEVLHTG